MILKSCDGLHFKNLLVLFMVYTLLQAVLVLILLLILECHLQIPRRK